MVDDIILPMDLCKLITEIEDYSAAAWQKGYSAIASIVYCIGYSSECVTLPTISYCVRMDSKGNVMFNSDGIFKFAEELDDATMFAIMKALIRNTRSDYNW